MAPLHFKRGVLQFGHALSAVELRFVDQSASQPCQKFDELVLVFKSKEIRKPLGLKVGVLVSKGQFLETNDPVLVNEDSYQVETHVWRIFVKFEESTVISCG